MTNNAQDWEKDFLEQLSMPKGNFTDKNKWLLQYVKSLIKSARLEERRRWSKSLQDALDLRTELKEKIRFEGGVEAIEMVGKEVSILGKYYLQMWRDKYDKK